MSRALSYEIKASDISISDKRMWSWSTIRRALRETINPLFSQSSDIQNLKKTYKLSNGSFKCPICKITTHKSLDLAHKGEGAYQIIDKIMAENPNDSYNQLHSKIVDYHKKNVVFVIACRKCNNNVANPSTHTSITFTPISTSQDDNNSSRDDVLDDAASKLLEMFIYRKSYSE